MLLAESKTFHDWNMKAELIYSKSGFISWLHSRISRLFFVTEMLCIDCFTVLALIVNGVMLGEICTALVFKYFSSKLGAAAEPQGGTSCGKPSIVTSTAIRRIAKCPPKAGSV